MWRRAGVLAVLVLTVTMGARPALAIDLLPGDLTIDGPVATDVGDAVAYSGQLSFSGIPVPLTTVELFVDGTFVGSSLTDILGEYTIPHTFGAPGVYDVNSFVDGVFIGTSPTLEVHVGSNLLTVVKAGTGAGTVTSTPAGIDCGTDCTEVYVHSTSVSLSAAPASGNAFSGWGGDCSGTGACTVVMSAARTVIANFSDTAPPGGPVLTGSIPASPANDNTPDLVGTAQPGSSIALYTNASCAGAPVGTGTATGGTFTIGVTVADDSATTFFANATDAGGTGPCSSGFTYIEDSLAPAPPVLTASVPASPANDNDPVIIGGSESGSTVTLYTTPTCAGPAAGTGGAPGGSFTILVSVPDNTTTTFYGTASDGAGNTSACSSGLTYVEDSLAPDPPILTGTTPASPADNNSPTVHGTSDAGAVIRIYKNAACTGVVAAVVTASGLGTFSATIAVPDDATTIFRATASDGAGNTSACSGPLSYVEDSSAPASPSITGSSPMPPANDNTPEILGVSEPTSIVRLFTNASCAGAPVAFGTATGGGTFSITVTVADDSTTILFANAEDSLGHISTCSAGFTYVEDSTPPGPVVLTGTVPASPANNNQPHLLGVADPDTDVKIFTNPTCSGAPPWADHANPATGGAFSTQVTVPDDSSTTFYAHAIDEAGNVGPCSAGLTYVEDSSAPAAPLLTSTSPGSPADNNTPTIIGTAETGSTVTLYTTATCSGAAAGTGPAGPGFSIVVTVADDTTTTFYATATDAAGNVSPCSSGITYIEDTTSATPAILGSIPGSPANDNNPTLHGIAEPGATVTLYTTNTCTGPAAGSGLAPGGSFSIAVTVADDTSTTFYAQAIDVVLNVSACSSGFTYEEDSTPPGPPVLTGTVPLSPANDNQPHVHGMAEPGVNVFLFRNGACIGIPEWADRANPATGGAFSMQVNVDDNTTTTFSAYAKDAAGNVSLCSNTVTYTEVSP